jgi:hypothetical protein
VRTRSRTRAISDGSRPHAVEEVVAGDLLEHVARGAGQDRREQRLVVVVAGQDQRLDVRVDRADLPAHVDAAAVGEPAVEHRDVGPERGDPRHRLDRGAGLAHDGDVTLALEQVPQAPAHHLVVVEQEDADRVGGHVKVLHASVPPARRPVS